MIDCIAEQTLPLQALIMSLIAKKSGGTRAIALVASVIRLLLGILKSEVREWNRSVGLSGDTGKPGVSLELETARRHLRVRTARDRGCKVVQLLWGVEKFYDSTSVTGSVKATASLGFPKIPSCCP